MHLCYIIGSTMDVIINKEKRLMDAAYHTPNATTIAAMKEAEDDSTLTTVNMDNYDSFIKSLSAE